MIIGEALDDTLIAEIADVVEGYTLISALADIRCGETYRKRQVAGASTGRPRTQ